MTWRRTFRRHALLIALAVLVSPLLLVISTNWIEALFGDRTRERGERSASEMARALDREPERAPEVAKELAGRGAQRIRVLDAQGNYRVDQDGLVSSDLKAMLGDLFYGPERDAVLSNLDRDYGPPLERFEVKRANELGRDTECRFVTAGNLFVCATALKVTLEDGKPGIVHVETWSRRALRALYESRRQLLKLFLFAGALAILLAWWTLRSFVKPVENLRDLLLSRATDAVPRSVALPSDRGLAAPELADLTRAFNSVLSALHERTQTNEAFLADLAHEFKNPIAAIRACSEQMTSAGPLDETRKARLASVLQQSSAKLDSLVMQFLELARAEAGLPNEPREAVDLTAQLRGLITAIAADPRFARVRIQCEIGEQSVTVHGVSSRLEMAFQNLLINAASFAGDDGEVNVRLSAEGGTVRVSIQDSGPGIDPAHLPKLFDRFFSRRGDKHGTGLGLALVRAVVEAHGGSVAAESEPGAGATFVVRIPIRSLVSASTENRSKQGGGMTPAALP